MLPEPTTGNAGTSNLGFETPHASRTDTAASGDDSLTALTGGYHAAFLAGAVFAVAGAVVGGLLIRAERPTEMHAEAEPARS